MITSTTESQGFRLYYRVVREEGKYPERAYQGWDPVTKRAVWGPETQGELGVETPDSEWKWHRKKTYAAIGHAKAAARYHYKDWSPYGTQYETKIVTYKITILEEEVS